jgi:FMN reductase
VSAPVVFIAGSPSASSRSSFVAKALAVELEREGLSSLTFSVHDFDPADVLLGRADAPGPRRLIDAVKGSAALVLSTPVYKATYSGGLKALVDLIPSDAVAGRPALGIATARRASHGLAVTRALLDLFSFFDAPPREPLMVLDEEIRSEGELAFIASATRDRVAVAARDLVEAIRSS